VEILNPLTAPTSGAIRYEGNGTGVKIQKPRLSRIIGSRSSKESAVPTGKRAVAAGRYSSPSLAKGWGLVDSIVLCTTKVVNGSVVTDNEQLSGLDRTVFIREQRLAPS
jgi:hypothetical protein